MHTRTLKSKCDMSTTHRPPPSKEAVCTHHCPTHTTATTISAYLSECHYRHAILRLGHNPHADAASEAAILPEYWKALNPNNGNTAYIWSKISA